MYPCADGNESLATRSLHEPREGDGCLSALVVCYDAAVRNRLEAWLESAGFAVEGCPGPGAPAVCPQIHGAACPLATAADVVVLDLELLGSFDPAAPPGWVLLDTYLERGSNVVALAGNREGPPVLDAMPTAILPRTVDRKALLAAVHSALAP